MSLRHAVLLGCSFVFAATACHHAHEAAGGDAPGQAWLTETQMRDAKIAVEPVEDEDVDDTIVTSGKVAFDDTRVAHVYSPVTGKVTRIDASLGQRLKKGDVLAVIDSPDLGNASADVGKAQADMIAAENDYRRKKGLFDQHAASQVDVEQSEDNYHKAQAELARSREKLRLLKGGDGAYVSQGFALTSPIDGEVMSRNLSPGVEVQGQYGGGSAVELFMIGEIDKVWLFADVYEMDVARVKVGSPVKVKVVAYPDRVFDSKIDWISGTLDPQTRTVRVRCSFDNPDKLLKPEMYATVTISVDQKKALALPHDAIVRMGDQNVVFVEMGKAPDGRMRFERRPVSVDLGEGNKWVPVDHGVEKGQRVVVSGGILLSGMM